MFGKLTSSTVLGSLACTCLLSLSLWIIVAIIQPQRGILKVTPALTDERSTGLMPASNAATLEQHGFIAVMETLAARLGNAMFVHASMLGIAATYGLNAVLVEGGGFNEQLQACFNLQTPVMSRAEFARLSWRTALSRTHSSNILVGQYLQSWRYFRGISGLIRSEFIFKHHVAVEAQARRDLIMTQRCQTGQEDCLVVGVHNRRGDYAVPSAFEFGFLTADAGYFVRAMAYLTTKYEKHHLIFAFVTDDQPWLTENLLANVSLAGAYDMLLLPDAPREVDLCFLSMADHVIMSVGTFGWWGAYLCNGTVIYKRDIARQGSAISPEVVVGDMMPLDWVGL